MKGTNSLQIVFKSTAMLCAVKYIENGVYYCG